MARSVCRHELLVLPASLSGAFYCVLFVQLPTTGGRNYLGYGGSLLPAPARVLHGKKLLALSGKTEGRIPLVHLVRVLPVVASASSELQVFVSLPKLRRKSALAHVVP